MDTALVLKLVGAALSGWWHVRIERDGQNREARWSNLRRYDAKKTGVWRKGPVVLPVTIVSESGAKVNLGTSFETPDAMTSNAELDSESLVVEIVNGPRIALARGAKLVIDGVVGADRRLLRVVTTEDGAKQEFSFELGPGHKVWIIGELTHDVTNDTGGPFRGYTTGELAPLDGTDHVSARAPDRWISGCGTPLALACVAIAAIPALYGAEVAFWVAAGLALLTIAMQHITLPGPPPDSVLLPPTPSSVRAEVAETDEHAEDHEVDPDHDADHDESDQQNR